MSYCPIIKKECPKSHDECEFWEEKEEHERCKDGGCEGYGWDCDICSRMAYWTTGGTCSLKKNMGRR